MDRRLKPLFSALETSLSNLDTQAAASLYADAFTSAGPHGAIAFGRKDLVKQSEKAAQPIKARVRNGPNLGPRGKPGIPTATRW